MLRQTKVKSISKIKFEGNSDEVVKSKYLKKVDTDGTAVQVGVGLTLSKNYNSARIDCSVTFPTIKRKAKETAKEAWDFVSDELSAQINDVKSFLEKL